jgi:hypothetical protein
LVNGRFFAGDEFLHKLEYYDKECGVSLGGRTYVITLELPKLEYLEDKPVREMSAVERARLMSEYKYEADTRRAA